MDDSTPNSTSVPTAKGYDVKILRTSVRDADAPKAPSGEITPLLPHLAKRVKYDVVVQEGWFGSYWVRPCTGRLTAEILETLLNECEGKAKGAVYAALPDALMAADDRNGREWLSVVLERGYNHHHFHRATSEICYYQWFGDGPDVVPTYATSIEGGGALVISPNGKEVLLARNRSWKDSHWARVGGAVNFGESCLDAAIREVIEETQVTVDKSVPPRLLLCYNREKARDGLVNDHFMMFAVQAASKDMRPDKRELLAAQWFDIGTLVDAWKGATAGLDEAENLPKSIDVPAVGGDATMFGGMELLALSRWADGICFREREMGGRRLY